MVLRRLITALRSRDWFTVLVEILIVVLGVYLGIQLGNWNAAAQARSREAVVLEQLAEEFTSTVQAARDDLPYADKTLTATRDVLRVIRAGEEPDDPAAFLQTLRRAGSFAAGPPEPVTLTELLSSGGLSGLTSPTLRRALIRYHETADDQRNLSDLILSRVSAAHDGFHAAIEVNPDFAAPEDLLLDRYDWDLIPATRPQFQVILYGKLGLSANLDELIARGEAVLAEIEAART